MYPVSEAFLEAVQTDHKVVTRCDVYYSGYLERTLDITDGNVTVDDVNVHRQVDLTLTDPDPDNPLTPGDATDLFAPKGTEIKVYRGVQFNDGTEEYCPLGVFPISRFVVDDSGQGLHIRIEGDDRAGVVAGATFLEDFYIALDTRIDTAIYQILLSRAPWLPTNLEQAIYNTPLYVFQTGEDPWGACRRIAENHGYELLVDPNGVAILRTPLDPVYANIAQSFIEGEAGSFLYANKTVDRADVYNGVIVIGERATDQPVRAEAWDLDVTSPFYRYGPFGEHPYTHRAGTLSDTAAQAAADSLYIKYAGLAEVLQVQALVNPALDTGDIIEIKRDRINTNGLFVITKITIPLIAGRPMYIATRKRKVN